MAGGYLGKISAVISANTGDYVRGLNEGAKATRDFAKTVQSTLNRSATEAARAFEGIYTPLQQFERAIRQAGALRLNFKGFEGAVRNINDLQKRLNGVLTSNEIDLVVRTSGLKDIEAVRQAINSLSQKEITLTSNAGGLPGLLKARAELQRSGGSDTLILNTKATQAELDALIQKLNVLDDRRIEVIIDVLNQQGLEKAVLAARRLQDAVTNIARPFAQTTQTFNQLAGSVQAAFIPAFGKIQTAVDRFGADLESNASVSVDRFEAVRQGAEKAAAAVNRLAEAQKLANSGATGRELAFVSPRVADDLRRSAALSNQAAELPASVIAENPQIAKDVQQLQNLRNLAVQYEAEVEKQRFLNLDTTQAQNNLNNVLLTSQRVQEALSERIAIATSTKAEDSEIARLQYKAKAEADLEAQRDAALRKAFDQEVAILQYRARAEAEIEEKRAAAARKAEDDEIARLINRERAAMERDRQEQSIFPSRDGNPPPGSGPFGPTLQPAIDKVGSDIRATRMEIEKLDGPLREQLGPEVDNMTNKFQILARSGVKVSADEIKKLAKEAAAITDSLESRRGIANDFASQFGGAGAAGLGLGVDQRSLRSLGAEVEFVQQKLSGLSANVRGPVLTALEQLRVRAVQLFSAGTFDTKEGQQEINALRKEIIQLLSAAGAGSEKKLAAAIKRVGDVSRGGFDRFSLGIQQAAFAVEDFFSVTGGLDQRVRAAGNNISQLGFILGGTSGLIAGIAGAIGSQLIVALIKWANNGRTTEDQMKAINDTLSRQKTLVEELSDAFRSLGDSIGRGALSPAARDAEEFGKALDDIRKRQRELREQRAFGLDEGVLQARADVNVAQNRLDRAATRDEAVAAQRQLDEARGRLENEQNRVRFVAGPNAQRGADAIFARARDEAARQAAVQAARVAAATTPDGGAAAGAAAAQVAFEEGERARRRVAQSLANAGDDAGRIRVLREDQRRAEARGDARVVAELERLINSLETERVSRALDQAAIKIFESGNRVGQSLERSQAVVSAAIEAGIPGAENFSAQVSDAGRALRTALSELAAAESITGPGRQEAVDAARRSVQAAEQRADGLAGQARNLEAATSALQRFTDALQATTRIAESNLNSAEGRRDRAREEALGRPTPRNRQALDRAERDVQRQRELVEAARREEAQAQERARSNPQAIADERRLREIEGLLSGADGFIDQAGRQRLIDERETLRARQEARARDAANDPRVTAARDASIREEQRQQSVARGRELLLQPGERERLDLERQIADIRAASEERRAIGGFGIDNETIAQQEQAAIGRAREEAARSVAPTIFGLADQVQNAILQGPSRAALAPTDVTTMEGSRELTRLLRGDDASRNQDLVNLQKEANRLLKVLADNGADVAA